MYDYSSYYSPWWAAVAAALAAVVWVAVRLRSDGAAALAMFLGCLAALLCCAALAMGVTPSEAWQWASSL